MGKRSKHDRYILGSKRNFVVFSRAGGTGFFRLSNLHNGDPRHNVNRKTEKNEKPPTSPGQGRQSFV